MCLLRVAPPQETPAPAAVALSPVTRAYLSRALGGFFRPPRVRLFYQGTRKTMGLCYGKVKAFLSATYSPSKGVNNFGIT
jgi:hypothetical protein